MTKKKPTLKIQMKRHITFKETTMGVKADYETVTQEARKQGITG